MKILGLQTIRENEYKRVRRVEVVVAVEHFGEAI
jgi:hypothetical protein